MSETTQERVERDPDEHPLAERLAAAFHRHYEDLAPLYGYKTREASAVPWEDVPENNKLLMIAVADTILRATSKGETPMSDNDKCPTCGIAREHDGPHYHEALKQAGKPMCPDPFHDPAPEHPDKCPTCGSDDPAEYASPCDRALYSDDRSDPFHRSHEGVPSRVGLHGNVVAPKPQGLDAVSGDGTWDEADERYVAAMNTPSPDKVRGILRDEVVTVTDEERAQLEHAAELLEGALSSPTGWINSTAMLAYDTLRSLANRKPVGDGEVVVRLTREEAQELANLAELPIEETPWGATTRIRTPLSDKLRAALDQGGSDECETSAPENASNEGAHVTPDAVCNAGRERATDAESRKAGPQPEVGRESSGHSYLTESEEE